MDPKDLVSYSSREGYDTRKCRMCSSNVPYFYLNVCGINRKRFNRPLLRIFEMLSQSCYLSVISPTIERHTIATFTIYAFRSANSKGTPSTKPMENIRSSSTFLVALLSPLQHTDILEIDQLRCSLPFTLRFSPGWTTRMLAMSEG